MRKINLFAVLTAIVASTFTACTNTEDLVKPEQKALDFSVFANKNTRAPETAGTLNTDGKAFGVWGYSTFDDQTTDVFINQEVKRTAGKWVYTPLKFWDTSSSYEFHAYYPYQTSGVTIATDDATKNKYITITDFTVAPLVANHVDVMIATKVTRAAEQPIENVTFNFNHLLSNINLSFKKDENIKDVKVTLESVKIYGMSKKGKFVQSLTSHSGVWTVTSDYVGADDADLEDLANNNVLTTDAATSAKFSDMLFIPQNTNTLKVDVKYTLGEDGNKQPFFRTLDLSYDATDRAHNPSTWQQNQKITYNFTINANTIIFNDPDVVDWTNPGLEVEDPNHIQ